MLLTDINTLTLAVVFIVVSVVVSIDVVGLTLSKADKFSSETTGGLIAWGIYNGAWHAVLLAAYIGVIHITIDLLFFQGLLDQLKTILLDIAKLLPRLKLDDAIKEFFEIVYVHLNVIIGVLAILIVWDIYSRKIVSQPASSEADEELPMLATLVFSVIELICHLFSHTRKFTADGISRFLHRNFQAALVAVDMLALAIILKSLGLIVRSPDIPPEKPVGDPWVIIGMVFVLVALFAYFSALYGGKKFKLLNAEKQDIAEQISIHELEMYFLKIGLRFLEPFFIFYFVMGLLTYLVYGEFDHSIGLLFGSALMVLALRYKHGYRKIVESCWENDAASTKNDGTPVKREDAPGDAGRELTPKFGIVLNISVVLLKASLVVIFGLVVALFLIALIWASGYLHPTTNKITSLDALVLFATAIGVTILLPIVEIVSFVKHVIDNYKWKKDLDAFLGKVAVAFKRAFRDIVSSTSPTSPPESTSDMVSKPKNIEIKKSSASQRLFSLFCANASPTLLAGFALLIAISVPAFNGMLECAEMRRVEACMGGCFQWQNCPLFLHYSFGNLKHALTNPQFHGLQLSGVLLISGFILLVANQMEKAGKKIGNTTRASASFNAFFGLILLLLSWAADWALSEFSPVTG